MEEKDARVSGAQDLGRVKGSVIITDHRGNGTFPETRDDNTPLLLGDIFIDTATYDYYAYETNPSRFELKGNLRGADGKAFRIEKSYLGIADMENDPLKPVGEFVIISSSDPYDPDNGKLYYIAPTGPQFIVKMTGSDGAQGPRGEPFKIKKTYSSVEEMNNSFDTDSGEVFDGDIVAIVNNVEDQENAQLYVRTPTGYEFLMDLSGATGIRGEDGKDGENGKDGLTPSFHIDENTGHLIVEFPEIN